jgi:multiple antibiotic resistance protein
MDISVFLHGLTSYFVIIDPIGAALIFHALMAGEENGARRKQMALKTCLISTVIVLTFAFLGEALLSRLGISIEALRVSGGILLFVTAFGLITREIEYGAASKNIDISVFPMSIPLIAGPGCLTLTILLFSNREASGATLGLVLAVLLTYGITFFALLFSSKIKALVGRTGDDILRRLLGVILAALAVQFISDGVIQLLRN